MIAALLLATTVVTCAPRGMDRAALDALKTNGFKVEDARERQAFALALADCLGDPDAAVRDGIAFEAT